METIDLVRREIRALLDAYDLVLQAAASQEGFDLSELRHISGQCAGSLLLIAGVQHLPPWLAPRDELEVALRDCAAQRARADTFGKVIEELRVDVSEALANAEAAKAKVAEWMLTRVDLVERVTLRRDQFEGGDDARRLAWSELDKVRQLLESFE
jgi:hypothetical protein